MSALKEENEFEKFRVMKGGGNKKAIIAIGIAVGALAVATLGVSTYNTVTTYTDNVATGESLTTITESLEELYGNLGTVQTIVEDNRTVLGETDADSDIITRLGTLSSNIDTSKSDIQSLLNYINNGGSVTEEEYANIVENYNTIQTDVSNISTELNETITSINDQITSLEALNNENYNSTITTLKNVNSSFTQMNQDFNNNITKFQKDVATTLNQNYKDLSSNIDETYSTLNTNINKNNSDLNTTISNNYAQLNTSLNQNYNNLNTSISENYADLSNSVTENYNDLNTAVTNNYNDLSTSVSNNYANLNTTLENNYTTLNQNMTDNYDALSNDLDTKFANMETTITQGNADLQTYIGQQIGTVNSNVTSVFQYVSDGKTSVASAISDKGVATANDATFAVMYQNLTNLYNNASTFPYTYQGNTYTPANITPTIHTHMLSSGVEATGYSNIIFTDTELSGGCYVPYGHIHNATTTCPYHFDEDNNLVWDCGEPTNVWVATCGKGQYQLEGIQLEYITTAGAPTVGNHVCDN